jgi:hypothetical protein
MRKPVRDINSWNQNHTARTGLKSKSNFYFLIFQGLAQQGIFLLLLYCTQKKKLERKKRDKKF